MERWLLSKSKKSNEWSVKGVEESRGQVFKSNSKAVSEFIDQIKLQSKMEYGPSIVDIGFSRG